MEFPSKGFYYHYKRNPEDDFNSGAYEVIGISRNTDDEKYSVLYRPLYENSWVTPVDCCSRPVEEFFDEVNKNKDVVLRFQSITDPVLIEQLKAIKLQMYE